jgi:hypothetical protein
LHTWDFEADTVKAIACRNVERFVVAVTPGKVGGNFWNFNFA